MGPGGGGIANTLVLFACIYFVGKIDFTDPDNLLRLRITYGIVQAVTLAAFAYVYTRITAVADRTPVTLADGTVTTVEKYDLGKLKEFVRGTLMGTGISLFIHLKMGVVPPLFIQSVMAPIQTGQNALVRLYLLGDRSAELVNRPWKEPPSPFAALMGQQPAENNAAPADGPAPDAPAPAQANDTAAEESAPNAAEEPAAESTETQAEETPAPAPEPAAPVAATKQDKKPTSTKKGKSKKAAEAAAETSSATETSKTPAAVDEPAPAATEAPAAAASPAVSTLAESQEEPASPSADASAAKTTTRRRKAKAEQ